MTRDKLFTVRKTQLQIDQGLNIRSDLSNLIKETVQNTLGFIGTAKEFLDRTQ